VRRRLSAARHYLTSLSERIVMWYFAWVLGLGFAVLLAILNAMWGECAPDRQGGSDEGPA
jgi:cyd operon protein YbgT